MWGVWNSRFRRLPKKVWSRIVPLFAAEWGRLEGRQMKGRQEGAALDDPS